VIEKTSKYTVGNEIQIPLIGKGIKIRKGGKLE
jgi:hypothetical protein